MKLTKLQRYTAYCIMLAEKSTYEKYEIATGLCWVIYEQFGIVNRKKTDYVDKVIDENFPELSQIWRRKYNKNFKDWGERAAALEQCIKQTEPK